MGVDGEIREETGTGGVADTTSLDPEAKEATRGKDGNVSRTGRGDPNGRKTKSKFGVEFSGREVPRKGLEVGLDPMEEYTRVVWT